MLVLQLSWIDKLVLHLLGNVNFILQLSVNFVLQLSGNLFLVLQLPGFILLVIQLSVVDELIL